MTRSTKHRIQLAVVVALIGIAGWLPARHLDSHGLHLDELGTVWSVRGESLFDSIERVNQVQGQSPFFYVALRLFCALAGETELTLRLPSLFAGVAAMGVCVLALWRRRRHAVAVVFLFGCNAHLIFLSHQARPYTFACFGVLLAYWGLTNLASGGGQANRLLMWGGALVAAYSHTLFAPVLLVVLLSALRLGPALYSRRRLLLDISWVIVAAVPFAGTVINVFSRRGTLSWVQGDLSVVLELVPGALGVLLVAGVAFAVRWRRGKAKIPNRLPPAPIVFELLLATLPVLTVWVLSLVGTNLFFSRYLLLSALGLGLLLGRAISHMSAPAAAIALACLVLAPNAQRGLTRDDWPEWREAAAALDSLEPAQDDLVVLRCGFVESEGILDPPFALTDPMRGFCSAPLADRPGRPHDPRELILLPYYWGQRSENQNDYFETRVVPRLERAKRVFLVVPLGIDVAFERWLEWRFPGVFQRTQTLGPFMDLGGGPGVVCELERRS